MFIQNLTAGGLIIELQCENGDIPLRITIQFVKGKEKLNIMMIGARINGSKMPERRLNCYHDNLLIIPDGPSKDPRTDGLSGQFPKTFGIPILGFDMQYEIGIKRIGSEEYRVKCISLCIIVLLQIFLNGVFWDSQPNLSSEPPAKLHVQCLKGYNFMTAIANIYTVVA